MVTHSCTPMWTWANSGSVGYTFLPTGVKFGNTGSFLPASQAAQGHKVVPTVGRDSKPSRGISQDQTLQQQGWASL